MNKKINRKKAAICWLIWSAIYLYLLQYMVYQYSGVHLFSPSELYSKYNGFIQGQWSMGTSETLVFLTTVVLFFPVWFFGTKILYNINWNISSILKKHQKIKQKPMVISATGHKLSMPLKLKAQPGAKPSTPANNPTPSQSPTPTPQTQDETQLPDGLIEMLTPLAEQNHLDLFQNLKIGDTFIPLALSSETHAFIIIIVGGPSGIITDTTNIIDGMWFTSVAQIPSPARTILKVTDQIHQLEESSIITPIILITEGIVDECDTVQTILAEHNIALLRYGVGGPDSLMDLETFLRQELKASDKNDNANTTTED